VAAAQGPSSRFLSLPDGVLLERVQAPLVIDDLLAQQ